jgi:acetoin utilization deacetylase AcuC-like enzyme
MSREPFERHVQGLINALPPLLTILSDRRMREHEPPPWHPESPRRLEAIEEALERTSLPHTGHVSSWEATIDEITDVHLASYVDRVEGLKGQYAELDDDTLVSPRSCQAARLAAGSAIAAVEAIYRGSRALALVRPPGHHALPDRSMGFCIYNNIAIAAEYARKRRSLDVATTRVLIVDWDVHHGNGTAEIFAGRDDVLVFGTHQEAPFWPGTGAATDIGRGAGRGYTVNVPMPEASDDRDHLQVFERVLGPIAEVFEPQIVLVSAGFDAHALDPLGGQRMTEDGFAALCAFVRDIADRHAGGRLALLLEGGYDLDATARSVAACARILVGDEPPTISGRGARGELAADRAIAAHRDGPWAAAFA